MGLFLKVQRKGKTGLKEPSWNTKGLAKAYKLYFKAYKEAEAERTLHLAQIQAKEKELEQEKAKLGIE